MDLLKVHFVQKKVSDIPHTHNNMFEFHFCIGGEAVYRNERDFCRFSRGAICFAAPGEEHQLILSEDNLRISFYYLLFRIASDEEALIDALREKFRQEKFFILNDYDRDFFDRLKRRLETPGYTHTSATHLLWVLIYDLLSCSGNRDRRHTAVDKAIKTMQNSMDQGVNLDELAHEVGLNKSYFIRLFKEQIGIPPLKYFNKLKIETACYLLTENHMAIAEIARYLGFYDEYHFSKVFKRFIKSTPGRYRDQHVAR